jgi:hypothetical protein
MNSIELLPPKVGTPAAPRDGDASGDDSPKTTLGDDQPGKCYTITRRQRMDVTDRFRQLDTVENIDVEDGAPDDSAFDDTVSPLTARKRSRRFAAQWHRNRSESHATWCVDHPATAQSRPA